MAPRTTGRQATKDQPDPNAAAAAPAGLAVLAPSSGLQKTERSRESKPNPLAGAVEYAKDNGPQKISVPVELAGEKADARAVTNMLRRDADGKPLRLSIQYQDGKGNVLAVSRSKDENGKTVTTFPAGIREVHFSVKEGKKNFKYTADDIRAWAKDNGHGDLTGKKVPPNVRDAFKRANGYAKDGQST